MAKPYEMRFRQSFHSPVYLTLLVFGLCLNPAWGQNDSPPAEIIAVVGAELRTSESTGTIPNGVVLIQGDTILAVGDSTLILPAGARTIDAKGCVVTPGLIDARSKLWLDSDSANATASDASLDAADGIDPYSDSWHEVLASGVTSIYVQPSSRGSLGGYGAVVSVMPKAGGGASVLATKAGLQASIGVMATNNRSRQQELERTKKILDAAIEYRKKWEEYDSYIAKQAKETPKDASKEQPPASKPEASASPAAPATPATPPGVPSQIPGQRGRSPGGRPTGPPESIAPNRPMPPQADGAAKADSAAKADGAAKAVAEPDKSKEKPVKKPDRETAKEDLLRVIKGDIPLRLEVHGPDDVHFAMKLLEGDSMKAIQVVFDGLSDLRSASKIIRDSKNPVVLGPWLDLEKSDSEFDDSADRLGSDFANYDGIVAIASNGKSDRSSKLLRAHAAKAISVGFSPERALKAITIDAAKALGVGDRIGSLAKGKRADLVCFRGEPTSTANPVVWVMNSGVIYGADKPQFVSAEMQSEREKTTTPTLDLLESLPRCFELKSSRCWFEGRLQPAVIQVCDGKILSISQERPETQFDHPTFDLSDAVITPGLVSAHANFGLARVIDPQQEPDASLVFAADGFARDFNGQRKLVRDGLLRALLAPGSSNPIAGNASLVRIGATAPEYARDAAAKFVLANSARNPNRFPSSLAGQIQMVSQSLKGTLLPSRVYLPASIEQKLLDRRTSSLKDVASGKSVAIIEAQTDAEIQSALHLIETQKLNALLLGPKQLKTHIDHILKSKSTIVVQPMSASSYDWYVQDIVMAMKAGIPICFAGESAEQLRLTASMVVAAGADHDQTLSALSEIPKALLGSAAKPGIAKDEPADLVIWSGSPLNLGAKPHFVLIDGQVATTKDN